MRRRGFTLFELILAIALSATLLGLIGTAVNLYLMRMDAGRNRVEEAQLARSILSTIAADIRATTVYQTQDISTVQQLAQASADINVDDIDAAGVFGASSLGAPGGTTAIGGATDGAADASGDGASGNSSTASSELGSGEGTSPTGLAPGLNGLMNELMLDVSRLPRLDEMFPAVQQAPTGVTAATVANVPRPSDLKTVRYFVRQGTAIDPSDPAATAVSPDSNLGVGGLVRQTIDRAIRQVAEQSANSQILSSGQVLLAPEVTQVQFIFFDGTTAVDSWDMSERQTMPTAVDVRIWIAPDAIDAADSSVPLQPRMYNQTVELPLAQSAGAGGAAAGEDEETDDGTTTDDESTTGNTGVGFGSALTQ
jgi:prepilin-type N-terminal cleavage/methylation domain-containing protein